MSGRARELAVKNGRRLTATIRRVEQQPYNTMPERRAPRIAGGDVHLTCQLTGTLAAATGTYPTITCGKLTNQTIYINVLASNGTDYTLASVATGATVINNSGTSFVASKTTTVRRTGVANVFAVVVQDC